MNETRASRRALRAFGRAAGVEITIWSSSSANQTADVIGAPWGLNVERIPGHFASFRKSRMSGVSSRNTRQFWRAADALSISRVRFNVMMEPPSADEFVPYFAGYVSKAKLDPIGQLATQAIEIKELASSDDAAASVRPSPGEWSLKKILQHLCDFERMFAYRALRFSRGDTTPVAAFEQDDYIAAAEANERDLATIVEELVLLRASTLLLFESFTLEMMLRRGTAGGNAVSVRALLFITAGHCEGHLEDIRRATGESPWIVD